MLKFVEKCGMVETTYRSRERHISAGASRTEDWKVNMTEFSAGLAALLEALTEASLTIQDGRVSHMNAAAEELLGPQTGMRAQALHLEDSMSLGGRTYIVRRVDVGGVTVVCLVESEPEEGALMRSARPREELDAAMAGLRGHVVELESKLLDAAEGGLWDKGEHASQYMELHALAAKIHRDSAIVDRMLGGRMLIDDLMSGRRKPEIVRLDAAGFCRSIAGTVGYFAKRRGIRVTDNCAVGETIPATFDPELVEIALLHLICNALAHLKSGGTLSLTVREDAGQVIFTVSDDGSGMDEAGSAEMHSRDHFGVRCAGAIAAVHGGTLAVKSVPGRGTFTSCSFPTQRDVGAELNSDAQIAATGGIQTIFTQLAPWLEPEDFDPRLMD